MQEENHGENESGGGGHPFSFSSSSSFSSLGKHNIGLGPCTKARREKRRSVAGNTPSPTTGEDAFSSSSSSPSPCRHSPPPVPRPALCGEHDGGSPLDGVEKVGEAKGGGKDACDAALLCGAPACGRKAARTAGGMPTVLPTVDKGNT